MQIIVNFIADFEKNNLFIYHFLWEAVKHGQRFISLSILQQIPTFSARQFADIIGIIVQIF